MFKGFVAGVLAAILVALRQWLHRAAKRPYPDQRRCQARLAGNLGGEYLAASLAIRSLSASCAADQSVASSGAFAVFTGCCSSKVRIVVASSIKDC